MQRALRSAVKRANPQGAILAEAEPGAFNATADATWDFELALGRQAASVRIHR